MDLVQLALDCGAAKAAYLDIEQVVLCADFRKICEKNGCGNYNRCYMCPPDIGPIEALMEQVRQFDRAVLYQSVSVLQGSFDFAGMMEAGHKHAWLSQKLQENLPSACSPMLHLSSGGCHLCKICAKREDAPCRYPEKALASLEGYGVDVCSTARAAGLPYINGKDTVTYFGILFFME